jgi:hypothetical protein
MNPKFKKIVMAQDKKEDKELTFVVTKEEADIIANALSKQPLELVINVWGKIQNQAAEQLKEDKK